MSEDGTDNYAGAGDGQCLGLKADGERCTNGVYASNYCCGTHKNASDVTLAPDADDQDWFECPECGWQPVGHRSPGLEPCCDSCGVQFDAPLTEWGDRDA